MIKFCRVGLKDCNVFHTVTVLDIRLEFQEGWLYNRFGYLSASMAVPSSMKMGRNFIVLKAGRMQRNFSVRIRLAVLLLSLTGLFGISATSHAPRNSYSSALRRYPYLTDVVGSYATINWATDRSDTSGLLR